MQTANHDLMRNTNTTIILDCIWDHGPMTKREIQKTTGLSWGAISNITTELLKKKVIIEFRSNDLSVGRIPNNLDINSHENLIIGIDINISGLTAVLVDLKCNVQKSLSVNIDKLDRENVLKQIKELIHAIIDDSEIRKSNLLGIGVAMQGAVDAKNCISIYTPYFNNWQAVPIGQILSQEFDMPVLMDHDPNCMALSERWFGAARGVLNLLFIRLSMGGIGMSITIDGNIYRGADGSAGEFGHITMDPDGPKCTCGNYGCLEVYASGRSLLQKTREAIKLGRTFLDANVPDIDADVTLTSVINSARGGNVFIRSLFEEAGTYLGIGISNVINIFNPDLIVIGGDLSKCDDLYMSGVEDVVRQKAWKWSRANIVTSKLEGGSAAIGAACLFMQKIYAGEMMDILS